MASSSRYNSKYKKLTSAGTRQKGSDDDNDFDEDAPAPVSRTSSLPLPTHKYGLRSRSVSPVKKGPPGKSYLKNETFNESTSSLLSNASFLPDTPAHLLPPDAKGRGTNEKGKGKRNGDKYAGSDNESDLSEEEENELAKNSSSAFGQVKALVRRNSGIFLMLTAQIFASIMSVITRLLETGFETEFHAFQILFTRQIITVVMCSLYMWWTQVPHFPLGPKEVRWLLVARGVTGFFGVFGLYYSLAYLDIADATVISFLAPSVAGFLCYLVLKEPFSKTEMIAAGISVAGVILIARPTSFFGSSHPDESGSAGSGGSEPTPSQDGLKLDIHVSPGQRVTAILVALLGVLGAAGAYTTIRWIGKRAHPLISVNYFSIWCTIVSGIALLVVPSIGFQAPHTFFQWVLLIGIGICGFCMQFLLTAALQRERAGLVTHMVYAQMVFALMWDKLIWDRLPAWSSWLGSGLILGSLLWVAIRKNREKNPDDVLKAEARRTGHRDEERGLVGGANSDDDEDSDDSSVLDEDEARTLEVESGIQMQRIGR